ncbi:hypothetical protein GE061_014526 [Apolygus lucorum]|uniref:Voltage-dependent anion-selective channel protein 3 n=1 Tax=Apolygus lucorum TaxID=248454 RepID=A0A6A4JFU8_APOLU|nr:hypothetical protein GE061_014526 [Apolygus lucorum]
MGPPFFADLGKNARDIFNKGYNFGLLKLDIKTKTDTGVEFEIGGVQNLETKNVAGSLETKYKFKDFGISFSEKWNTDNILQLEVAASDICEGVKMSCMSIMTPRPPSDDEKSNGATDKILRFKNEYKNAIMAVNLESDFKAGGPTLGISGVFGLSGWLLGTALALDTETSKVMTYSLGMGFLTKDFILNTAVINKGTDFTGSIYHKVSDKLELGVFITWSADINVSESGVGCKYMVDPDTALRFKVNNNSILGAAYTHTLKEGVSVGLCAQINGKSLKEGGKKWNTDNELSTEVSVESLYEGLKVGCETSFIPKTAPVEQSQGAGDEGNKEQSKEKNEVSEQWFYSEKSLKLKSEYKNDVCALNLEALFKKSVLPNIKGGAVAGLGGWVIGGAAGADTSKQALTDYQFSMGYIIEDFVVNTTIARGMVFSASIYNKFNDSVESSVTMSYAINSKDMTIFGIGCRWHIDPDAVVRFKVDSKYMLGVGYSQKLRDGVSFSLSAMVSGKHPMEGNNNLGFSLELEA